MSAHTPEKLAYMANQIARNLALEPEPVAAVADHIDAFWTRRMKEQLIAQVAERGDAGMDRIAFEALARVAAGADPQHVTRATDPAEHGADGG